LSYFIQWCTPHAIHTCDPPLAVTNKDNANTIDELVRGQDMTDEQEEEQDERDLLKPILPPTPPLHNHPHHHKRHHSHRDLEYGSIEIDDQDLVDQDKNDYFLIGIQTAIAICIHKFPGL